MYQKMSKKYRQPYLQPYTGKDSRKTCPKCGKSHSFTLYLDGETGQPIHPTVGICNHRNSCGYSYSPRQFFIDNPQLRNSVNYSQRPTGIVAPFTPIMPEPPQQPQPAGLIPIEYVDRSMSTGSDFVQFLKNRFATINGSSQSIDEVCNSYRLGATRNGDVIFWQIDIHGNVRTGKIMRYDPATGKRVHAGGAINWVHNLLKKDGTLPADFNLVQSFFGEHLLSAYPKKTIAIVESEKTAIIASLFMPEYVWLAAGNINGLNIEKSKVLKDRSVILYPDLSKELPTRPTAFELWSRKAAEIRRTYGCKIIVSDYLEKIASDEEKENGLDIADYFLKLDLQSPRSWEVNKDLDKSETSEIDLVRIETDELERWFNGVQLPDHPIDITPSYTICDPQRFVKASIRAIRSDKWDTEKHLSLLRGLKEVIETSIYKVG